MIAAARETGDIELYDATTWHCLQTFPGSSDAATTCIALVDEDGGAHCRIFSGGLDGVILEHDPETRRPAGSCDSYGGAVWQLEPEPLGCVQQGSLQRLAAACDDGCVRLFSVDVGVPGVAYAKSFPRVEGRTLAVAWHPSGTAVASAGTDGCIHIWSLERNRELLRITAGDTSGRRDYCVWDLLYLPDGTLVSADSDGAVQFWDGASGTLLRRFTQHVADVLRLAASPDGRTVFAAGVDPQMALFQLVKGGEGPPQWTYLSSKRLHTHDVRAMCVLHGKHTAEPLLLTGGNDTQLLAHSVRRFLKEHPLKVSLCPQCPQCQVSTPAATAEPAPRPSKSLQHQAAHPRPPRLLVSQRNQLDVWQLGSAGADLAAAAPGLAAAGLEEGAIVPPGAPPVHLARFQTRGGSFLTAAALSPAGDSVAFSDAHRVRAFQLAERPLPAAGADEPTAGAAGSTAGVAGLDVAPLALPANLPPASHLAFVPGSDRLVACALDGTIRIVDLAQQPQQHPDEGSAEGAAAGAAPAVQVVRDVYNLRHKVWAKRDRQRSAARHSAPAVNLLATSPDGRWLAVAARQRVHLLDLSTLPKATLTQLPSPNEPSRPITALAFTADSATLLAATTSPASGGAAKGSGQGSQAGQSGPARQAKHASLLAPAPCQLVAYDVATGQLTEWAQAHGEELSRALAAVPGPITGLAPSPASPSATLLHSSAAVCHLDMSRPLSSNPYSAAAAAGAKRRRGPLKPLQTSGPAGENCRTLFADDPLLFVQYVARDAVLVVEKPWMDVWQKLPPPVYRHRYGT
ncbi:hypothetical protein N2152v2_009331 [Parachlorella kessleri]